MKVVDWVLRILAAAILLQTLFFKFMGAEESVYIFTQLGAEPWGRIGSGIIELVASGLLLVPRTAWIGATVALFVMVGAILSHLFVIGINILGDGGLLFTLALVVTLCCLATLAIHRNEVPYLSRRER